jgi:hypothetical protein
MQIKLGLPADSYPTVSDGRTPGTDARGEVSCGFKTHSSAGGVDLPA